MNYFCDFVISSVGISDCLNIISGEARSFKDCLGFNKVFRWESTSNTQCTQTSRVWWFSDAYTSRIFLILEVAIISVCGMSPFAFRSALANFSWNGILKDGIWQVMEFCTRYFKTTYLRSTCSMSFKAGLQSQFADSWRKRCHSYHIEKPVHILIAYSLLICSF